MTPVLYTGKLRYTPFLFWDLRKLNFSPLIEGFNDLFGRFIVIEEYIPYVSEPKGPSAPGALAHCLTACEVERGRGPRQVWRQSLSSELPR